MGSVTNGIIFTLERLTTWWLLSAQGWMLPLLSLVLDSRTSRGDVLRSSVHFGRLTLQSDDYICRHLLQESRVPAAAIVGKATNQQGQRQAGKLITFTSDLFISELLLEVLLTLGLNGWVSSPICQSYLQVPYRLVQSLVFQLTPGLINLKIFTIPQTKRYDFKKITSVAFLFLCLKELRMNVS